MGLEGRPPKPKAEQAPKVPTPEPKTLADNDVEKKFFEGTVVSRVAEAAEKAQKAKDAEAMKKVEEEFFGPGGLEGRKKAA